MNPAIQVHVRLPTIFVQLAFVWQPPLPVKHSSISEKYKIERYFMNFQCWYESKCYPSVMKKAFSASHAFGWYAAYAVARTPSPERKARWVDYHSQQPEPLSVQRGQIMLNIEQTSFTTHVKIKTLKPTLTTELTRPESSIDPESTWARSVPVFCLRCSQLFNDSLNTVGLLDDSSNERETGSEDTSNRTHLASYVLHHGSHKYNGRLSHWCSIIIENNDVNQPTTKPTPRDVPV